MIRQTITPQNQDVSIHLPENYIGKQIEVLVYPVDEIDAQADLNKKPSEFRGALKLTDEQYDDFQNHVRNIRNEWDRDI